MGGTSEWRAAEVEVSLARPQLSVDPGTHKAPEGHKRKPRDSSSGVQLSEEKKESGRQSLQRTKTDNGRHGDAHADL